MKIIAMTIQITRTSQKLVTQNISPWKETLSKKLGFSVNPTALTLLSKVRPCTIILVQDRFFNLTIWKPTAQAFQNTLTFDRYLFNSMSNFHANLVHWNSLHPKNAILPTFLGQTPHFLCENEENRTDNLHHRKALSVAVILSLRVGVQHIQKVVQYFLQRGHSPLNVDDSALWILYMLKQLLSSSLMEVMKPGCPGNVESGETSLSWLYPQSIGSQCKIKDQRYCVWS